MTRRRHPSPATAKLFLALSSAALLVVSFPRFNQLWCAWVALIPWLALINRSSMRAAASWSYFIGLLFFIGSIRWLIHVTLPGWLLLCAYLAVFFALFGWIVHRIQRVRGELLPPCLIAAAWVCLEYLRSHLLSGFGWNLLAYSQTSWPTLIQLADVTGCWGISFLIVFVNAALSTGAGLVRHAHRRRSAWPEGLVSLGAVVACLIVAVGYGRWRLQHLPAGPPLRIAIVQGNIPQQQKWDPGRAESILQRYEQLTREAARTQPQLIAWPETSAPGSVGLDESMTSRLVALARAVRIPLLIGTPLERSEGDQIRWTNSAVLMDARGTLVQRYDKLHLVPYGEFLPFERLAPWLRQWLPPMGDFVPGTEAIVFPVGGKPTFGVLICFEDVFPDLARRFVRHGARLLINITNDAWFGPTAAAYQHAQASTFRAVELRVPVIRAANTGWSGCIDATGAWGRRVADETGQELFTAGTVTCELAQGATTSAYARWGDWFPGLCLVAVVNWLLAQRMLVRRRSILPIR